VYYAAVAPAPHGQRVLCVALNASAALEALAHATIRAHKRVIDASVALIYYCSSVCSVGDLMREQRAFNCRSESRIASVSACFVSMAPAVFRTLLKSPSCSGASVYCASDNQLLLPGSLGRHWFDRQRKPGGDVWLGVIALCGHQKVISENVSLTDKHTPEQWARGKVHAQWKHAKGKTLPRSQSSCEALADVAQDV
jgi:hypothetical protein